MKKILSLLLCMLMVLAPLSHVGAQTLFTPGTYEGTGAGFGGDITVKVTVTDSEITDIQVENHGETAGISDPAFDKIPEAVLAHQSIAVDAVAGATYTSQGLTEAIKAALLAAGASEEAIAKEVVAAEVSTELEAKTADVVIIGAGGAGLTAAVEVLRAGGSVIVVEKMAAVGGNTIAAGSALNAAGTDIQKTGQMAASSIAAIEEKLALEPKDDYMARWQESVRKDLDAYIASGATNVFDSVDLHKLQTYVDGDYVAKPELVEILGNGAPQALKFLEELGTKWDEHITAAVGATWQRSHQPTRTFGGSGSDFVLPQAKFVEENGGQIMLEHKAEELIVEDGRVVGVKGATMAGTPFEYRANKSVIMATGGFGANVEMRTKYNKHWANLDETVPTTNLPGAQGEGLVMAEAIGANLIGLEWIQLVTGSGSGGFTASIANNLYVNAEGNRFVAEDSRRDVLSGAVLEQTDSFFWLLTDAKTAWDLMGGEDYSGNSVERKKEQGLLEADTLEDLAAQMGVDADNLVAAVAQFNKAVTGEEADPLGRQLFEYTFDKGPYYAGKGYAMVHHTMGGIDINTQCQVLDTKGNVIPGFFAAGEVAGGIHGGNRLGGNAIADIIVFGQIAGQEAMK